MGTFKEVLLDLFNEIVDQLPKLIIGLAFLCFIGFLMYQLQYFGNYNKELINKAASMDLSQCKNDPDGFLRREGIMDIINNAHTEAVRNAYLEVISNCRIIHGSNL